MDVPLQSSKQTGGYYRLLHLSPSRDSASAERFLSKSLEKTKRTFSDGMADFFLGKQSIDDELLEELETRLLKADVGIDATTTIIDELQNDISRKVISDAEREHWQSGRSQEATAATA